MVVHKTLDGRRSTIRFELDLDALNDHTAGAKYSLDLRTRRDYGLHVAREHALSKGSMGMSSNSTVGRLAGTAGGSMINW